MLEPLADDRDVADAIGRDLTSEEAARVAAVLAKASELFRRASGQEFTSGSSAVRVKVNGGRALLRQRPVTTVDSVVDDRGEPIDWTRHGQWLHVTRAGRPLASHEFVTVTYSHGGPVPDLVRLTVAEVAAKVLLVDPNARAGKTQTQMSGGPYSGSETYATWAQGGQTMLAPDDLAIARSFRIKAPTVWVMQP